MRPTSKQKQKRQQQSDALDRSRIANATDGAKANDGGHAKRSSDTKADRVDPPPATATTDTNNAENDDEEVKPKPRRGRRRVLHDEEQRKQRRKNQCKLNQRRYRARQRGMISTLSLETETLSDYITELEAYEQFLRKYTASDVALLDNAVMDARPLLVVDQFVQFFHHGFALHSVELSELHERFVRFIAAPTLISQGATRNGVDALLLQLKRYTSYHAVFALHADATRVLHAAPHASTIVEVTGRMHLRLSRDTVMLVYPHIVANEALSYRVVGHAIEPACRFVFQFNDSGKVEKLELAVDFASAFTALLERADDVAELLARALISPHCELGIEPHEESAIGAVENKQLRLKFILL